MGIWRASLSTFSNIAHDFAYDIKASWSFRWKSLTDLELTTFAGSMFQTVVYPKQERRIVSVCLLDDGIEMKRLELQTVMQFRPSCRDARSDSIFAVEKLA